MTRPVSEQHLALVQAAHAIRRERIDSGQGATLLELAHRAQVGYAVARALVPKMKGRGHLQIVGERNVDYRNRPVAEYGPVDPEVSDSGRGWVNLGECMAGWAG